MTRDEAERQYKLRRLRETLTQIADAREAVKPFLTVTGIEDPDRVEKFKAQGILSAALTNAEFNLKEQVNDLKATPSQPV